MKKLIATSLILILLIPGVMACSENDPLEFVYTEGLQLTTPVQEDVRTPVNALRLPTLNPPSYVSYKGGEVLEFEYQAVAGNEEEVYLTVQLPHGYVEGSDIIPHIHYVYTSDTVGDQSRWGLSYSWADMGDTFPAETTIYTLTASTSNDSDVHHLSNFPVITGTGHNYSSMLICRLFRNSSNAADTYTDPVYLLEFDLHIEVESLGTEI